MTRGVVTHALMFSGLVEAVETVLSAEPLAGACRLKVARPAEFTDIKNGDSIAVDGACLTVENHGPGFIDFILAAESLRVLGWTPESLRPRRVNLERSLRFGDRMHGHMVSGHVEGLGHVARLSRDGESLFMDVKVEPSTRAYVWKKGAVALNGVSLTVNEFKDNVVSVCLIPETQRRTNLADLRVGDAITVESDWMAKAVVNVIEARESAR